jgi:glycerophosphoryl diester phosphodiesterase
MQRVLRGAVALLVAALAALISTPVAAAAVPVPGDGAGPLVIGHRGAAGYRP